LKRSGGLSEAASLNPEQRFVFVSETYLSTNAATCRNGSAESLVDPLKGRSKIRISATIIPKHP
jgi:hypothetical protein